MADDAGICEIVVVARHFEIKDLMAPDRSHGLDGIPPHPARRVRFERRYVEPELTVAREELRKPRVAESIVRPRQTGMGDPSSP